MKISILGGGNEVGASCLHIEIGGTNLLIDAGMRMHADDVMPAFGMLENLGKPDVVLVTHAHADHIGALPVIHSLFPNVPVYATPPTADLMKIMMKDSYKILEQRCRQTNTLPPYSEEQVTGLLDALLLFPGSGVLQIGDVKITSYRAGHILGAVMFLIEGDGEKLLATGDISFKAGRTIPGARVLHDVHPDVVIIESTYGNRAHTDRNTEEKRLAEHVAEIVSNGGFALIPAFALGRAQEVLLILQDYMDKGLIPEFPIYVDGLVTPISRVYKAYPHFLKGPVAHRINKHGDAFLTEGRCKAVTPKEREQIINGKPGCIIASSGMLIGGASSWYAERLIGNEKNAIFITGYQDEESPGRKLLNIADGIDDHIELNGTSYPVKCRVGKYGLSAHADANEMTRFIEALSPTYTLLVHGDDEARAELADKIDPRYHPLLTENGETYPFNKRSSGQGVVGKRTRNNPNNDQLPKHVGKLLLYRPADNEEMKLAVCTGVHLKTNTLICQTLKGKQVKLSKAQIVASLGAWNRSIDELKEAANRVFSFSRPYLQSVGWDLLANEVYSLDTIFEKLAIDRIDKQIAVALALQSLPQQYQYTDRDGTTYYTFNPEVKEQLSQLTLPIQGLRVNPAQALETVRTLMATNPHFMRCGVDHPGTPHEVVTLYFDFPDAVSDDERKEIAETVAEKTGWTVAFADSVRQDLLQAKLSSLLGSGAGSPSIYLNERKVVVDYDPQDGIDLAEAATAFKKETGFDLEMKGYQTSKSDGDSSIYQVKSAIAPLENNAAIEEAKRWAKDRGITIYKTSMKQQGGSTLMEVHFISPEVAQRHAAELEELSYRIGMPVTFAKNPKQNEIMKATLELLPKSWILKKNPSIHIDKSTVAVKIANTPPEEEKQAINNQLKIATGYTLTVSS